MVKLDSLSIAIFDEELSAKQFMMKMVEENHDLDLIVKMNSHSYGVVSTYKDNCNNLDDFESFMRYCAVIIDLPESLMGGGTSSFSTALFVMEEFFRLLDGSSRLGKLRLEYSLTDCESHILNNELPFYDVYKKYMDTDQCTKVEVELEIKAHSQLELDKVAETVSKQFVRDIVRNVYFESARQTTLGKKATALWVMKLILLLCDKCNISFLKGNGDEIVPVLIVNFCDSLTPELEKLIDDKSKRYEGNNLNNVVRLKPIW